MITLLVITYIIVVAGLAWFGRFIKECDEDMHKQITGGKK